MSRALSAADVIGLLDLKPLPREGGYFHENYRSAERLPLESLPIRYQGARHFGTAIYYLLTPDAFSALHRLPTDEVFHHYLGGTVTMLQLAASGGQVIRLGGDLVTGARPQVVVPRGVWQGSYLENGDFALLGTTMAPGFDPVDYEHGDRGQLLKEFPQFAELIRRLTMEE